MKNKHMTNYENMLLMTILHIVKAEYKHGKKISKAIQNIYTEYINTAETKGLTMDEYIAELKANTLNN